MKLATAFHLMYNHEHVFDVQSRACLWCTAASMSLMYHREHVSDVLLWVFLCIDNLPSLIIIWSVYFKWNLICLESWKTVLNARWRHPCGVVLQSCYIYILFIIFKFIYLYILRLKWQHSNLIYLIYVIIYIFTDCWKETMYCYLNYLYYNIIHYFLLLL